MAERRTRATRGTPAAAVAEEAADDDDNMAPNDADDSFVDAPGHVPACVKRGALLYLETDDVDLHHGSTAYGPKKNLLLFKLIRILKSKTSFILKCQMPGDESEVDGTPLEDIIAGIKLYERMHQRGTAAPAAPARAPTTRPEAAVPPTIVPRKVNVVTARIGLQASYAGAEFLSSRFFCSTELDLSKLVSHLGSSPPPCSNSSTLFKKLINRCFSDSARVMPPEDESGSTYRFAVDAVYDVCKQPGKARVPKGEDARPVSLSLFANSGAFVSAPGVAPRPLREEDQESDRSGQLVDRVGVRSAHADRPVC